MKWLITMLVLVVVVVLGVAFYRNWIVVQTANQPDKEATQVNITVDRAKAREDLKEARAQTRDLAQQARDKLAGATTLQGEIMAIDPAESQLTLMADGQPHVVRVDKDATIQRDQEKVGFETLKVGEKAAVTVKEENGAKVAQTITITPDD